MTGERTERRRWGIPAAARPFYPMLALAVIHAVAFLSGRGIDRAWLTAWAAATASTSLLFAMRRTPQTPAGKVGRDTWRWFGVAGMAWSAGAAVQAISRIVFSRSAVAVSPADLFFLIALGAMTAGFVMPIGLPRSARPWLRYLADTYVCACALFVVAWVAVFDHLYRLSGEGWADFLIELRYPLLDAVLLCGLLPMAVGTVRGYRRSAIVAYCALAVLTAADVLYVVGRLNGRGPYDTAADLAHLAGLLLLGAAPWVLRRWHGDATRRRLVGPGIAPTATAAAAAIFVAGHTLTGAQGLRPVVPIIAGSAVLVVLARLGELVHDNDRLRRAARTSEKHFRALTESINDVVVICDLGGVIEYVSAGAQPSYHYAADELLGRSVTELIHPEDLPKVIGAVRRLLREKGDDVARLACRVRAPDGTWLPTESTICRYGSSGGGAADRLLVTVRDFSEQAALQRQVTHLTFHDGLTGLPNRAYFEERAREVVERSHGTVAVIFVDLDGFTAVNDSIGHAGGDQVLAQAARRLRAGVPADDTVARWGSDEFAVLVEDATEVQAVVDLGERLVRTLAGEPYRVGDRSIVLTASVGVAFTEDDIGGLELIRNADVALSRAKDLGGGRVEVFAAKMHADVVRRLELGGELQRALTEQRFTVEFQPVVELSTSRVTGVEALVRWWRDGEFVPPEEFIGTAEESGLMIPLGNWVLREACSQVARWRASGWDIGLSINLRPREIAAPRFVESVATALDDSGLCPGMLTLEVEEEVLVDGGDELIARLSALRDLGVRLAIDDFGTGYASLAFLRQLPVDVIKIDPSFVAGLGRDETLTLLTRTIVRVGRDLGLSVVAEGIERPEQLVLLKEMGCPRGQGFLVARPMAAQGVEALVRTNPRGEASIPLHGSALSAG
ncbi:putative bifunctional diguanylate cyclase/phosphodiesterase [Actinoallomurus rhizosphaericola]|uniref:putative bifunctional diguanylate cyclase/phosphodiesterase n=1 Tax=Actinoallomurus rhizosphaericola TaxID=2952536 RepID=UPI0020918FA8|nr:EAL domain-containing protein [Actinoallomurus rhizosphaericola]MCO5991990.1 EAL domain-containing protein [Actinoallomurus rhizosphaericola]